MIYKKTLKSLFIICIAAISNASAQQWGDYTLYSVMNSQSTVMVDTNNTTTTLHSWSHASTAKTGYSSYLMPGGILWRTVARTGNSFSGGPICGEVQKVDWNGTILWDFVYSTTSYCTHHDICPMPNGNVLLIAYERKSAAEVAAAGCSTFSSEMWPDKIVEVQPTGATTGVVVWEWHAWDHLVQNTNASAANYQTSIVNHPELLNINYNAQKDWIHMNGVDYNPILDQVTFSSHNLSEIYVIDHSTTTAEAASHSGGNSGKGGDILYRWGHPVVYGASGTQILNVVHDAHWIKEGLPNAGYLAGYNNQGISSTQSCADFISTPVVGYNYSITLGSAYTPSSFTLRQASGGYNSNMGNVQRLANGNTLLCIATSGIIKEFSPTGTLLWSKTATGAVPKAFRYNACYVSNPAPAIPVITESAGVLSSTAATTYQWFLNGQQIAGETNQSITPSQSGIYVVRITDSNGCVYQYSTGYNYSFSTGIYSKEEEVHFNIYPNPTTGEINIQDAYLSGKKFDIFVYDAVGRLIIQNKNLYQLNLSEFENGVYYITLKPENAKTINSKIILTK
jgi:hypothetical protein